MELLSNAITIFIPFVVIVWLLVKKQRIGWALLVVSLYTVLINVVLKEIFRINPHSGGGFQLSKYSFPSLSSQLAITFWLYLALQKKKIICFIIALLLVLFVSFQRILSGQHSVVDVVGGTVIGIFIVLVFASREINNQDKWTRVGIGERFPDPLTPLSQDIFTKVYAESAMETLRELNLQSTRFVPHYKTFNGYLYHNFDLKRLPKLKLMKLILSFYTQASNTERDYYKKILNRDTAFFSKLEHVNLSSYPNSKLLEYFEQIQRKFIRRMAYETKVAFLSEGVAIISTLVGKFTVGAEFVADGTVASIGVDRQLARHAQDLGQFTRFIKKYRYRLISYDLISPTWEEKPEKILQIIKQYRSDGIDIEQKSRLVLSKKVLSKWVRLAKKYYLLKEARYDSRMIYFYWLRKILLQIGKNFTKTNSIEKDEDVFFISLQDLKDFADKKKQIRVKRVEWRKQFKFSPPSEFDAYDRTDWHRRTIPITKLTGVAASRGKAIGICKIITTIDQFSKLKKGEILVAPTTNPAWTSLFGLASAVITETGGVLCHAAIVAREYNIPCLVNVKEATHILKDGEMVEVDADKSIVRKLH